jgi:hypothetical protein
MATNAATGATMSQSKILQLDVQGVPQSWVSPERAASYYATSDVVWTVGEPCLALRGGINAASGVQSRIDVAPIIAVKGCANVNLFDATPTLTNRKLFASCKNLCAYCNGVFKNEDLTREHVHPRSRGGDDDWRNVVSACRGCNGFKADRFPHEAGMTLLYAPMVPSLYEDFILSSRNIRADVMEWLMARVPKGSRLM